MRQITFGAALAEALDESLAADPRVVLIGAGFVGLTPARAHIARVREKYADRIKIPPYAHAGSCIVGLGAALVGLRPLVDMGRSSFAYWAFGQILNEAPFVSYISRGRVRAPVVFHMLTGIAEAGGTQNSGTAQAMFWNTPGLQVVLPGSPADVKGLMKWALLRSQNPTVFLDHRGLMQLEGPVPEGDLLIPFGQAEVKRPGRDVTIVAVGIQVPRALEAAEVLAREDGIDAEVVDPRTLNPLDLPTILGSVRKTGRVVVTDESQDSCGVAAGLAALIADQAFDALRAPIRRVAIPDVPIPYAETQEVYVTPLPARIVEAVRGLVGRTPGARLGSQPAELGGGRPVPLQ